MPIIRLVTLLSVIFWYHGQVVATVGSCEDVECAKQAMFQAGFEMPAYDWYEIQLSNEIPNNT